MTQAAAAQVVGVQRQTVNIWLQRYRETLLQGFGVVA
jgi:DNA-binding XRE family transcriptional regulator